MDFIWIFVAFLCGLAVKQLGLPPLIGYLLAGFGLNFYGLEPHSGLDMLSNMGITLLLFTIGLKLKVSDMLKNEIWAASISFAAVWTIILVGIGLLLSVIGLTR